MTDKSLETKIELALDQLERVREDIKALESKIDAQYVTRYEFDPIKKIVYGMVTLVLTGVIGAILTLVIRK